MINIAICDDEKSVVAKVREIADEVLSQADCTYVVNEYADSRSLISDVCEGGISILLYLILRCLTLTEGKRRLKLKKYAQIAVLYFLPLMINMRLRHTSCRFSDMRSRKTLQKNCLRT